MDNKVNDLAIYFAGAIRGGRDDAVWYGKMITFLGQYGDVLTEHVGNELLLADEKALSEQEIFIRDMAWLVEANVMIAEVTTPSLGVGYELGVAQTLGKRVLCLFRSDSGRNLSAMVAGNNLFEVEYYTSFAEACDRVKDFLKRI